MNPNLREDLATIATCLPALLTAIAAVVGSIHYGVWQTLGYGVVLSVTYVATWWMFRLTTRSLRRQPAPAEPAEPGNDDNPEE